jgi:hypothetical protein
MNICDQNKAILKIKTTVRNVPFCLWQAANVKGNSNIRLGMMGKRKDPIVKLVGGTYSKRMKQSKHTAQCRMIMIMIIVITSVYLFLLFSDA